MNGLVSSSASGRASPDALVAAACHYRTVNLPTLVIGPADSVPVLAIGLVTKDFKVSASIRSNSWIVGHWEGITFAFVNSTGMGEMKLTAGAGRHRLTSINSLQAIVQCAGH